MLQTEEARRRIAAARLLRGLSQEDIDLLGYKDGLGRQELSRTERGELPLTKVRRQVLSEHLRFPEEWFLWETVDDLVRWPAEGLADDQVRRAAELLAPRLLEAAQALREDPAEEPRDQAAPDRPPGAQEDDPGSN